MALLAGLVPRRPERRASAEEDRRKSDKDHPERVMEDDRQAGSDHAHRETDAIFRVKRLLRVAERVLEDDPGTERSGKCLAVHLPLPEVDGYNECRFDQRPDQDRHPAPVVRAPLEVTDVEIAADDLEEEGRHAVAVESDRIKPYDNTHDRPSSFYASGV